MVGATAHTDSAMRSFFVSAMKTKLIASAEIGERSDLSQNKN
jgi:hypothetical protein